jgi:hypothetical protein
MRQTCDWTAPSSIMPMNGRLYSAKPCKESNNSFHCCARLICLESHERYRVLRFCLRLGSCFHGVMSWYVHTCSRRLACQNCQDAAWNGKIVLCGVCFADPEEESRKCCFEKAIIKQPPHEIWTTDLVIFDQAAMKIFLATHQRNVQD